MSQSNIMPMSFSSLWLSCGCLKVNFVPRHPRFLTRPHLTCHFEAAFPVKPLPVDFSLHSCLRLCGSVGWIHFFLSSKSLWFPSVIYSSCVLLVNPLCTHSAWFKRSLMLQSERSGKLLTNKTLSKNLKLKVLFLWSAEEMQISLLDIGAGGYIRLLLNTFKDHQKDSITETRIYYTFSGIYVCFNPFGLLWLSANENPKIQC